MLADLTTQLKAVQLRQVDLQKNQIGSSFLPATQGLNAISHRDDVKSVPPEGIRSDFEDLCILVGEQDFHGVV